MTSVLCDCGTTVMLCYHAGGSWYHNHMCARDDGEFFLMKDLHMRCKGSGSYGETKLVSVEQKNENMSRDVHVASSLSAAFTLSIA